MSWYGIEDSRLFTCGCYHVVPHLVSVWAAVITIVLQALVRGIIYDTVRYLRSGGSSASNVMHSFTSQACIFT